LQNSETGFVGNFFTEVNLYQLINVENLFEDNEPVENQDKEFEIQLELKNPSTLQANFPEYSFGLRIVGDFLYG